MVLDQAEGRVVIAAGVGCRKGVSPEAVIAALEQVSEAYGISAAFMATAPIKSDERGLREAAARLGMTLIVVEQADLDAAACRTMTKSLLSSNHAGSPSVSEASALAACGTASRLIGPRMSVGHVTVAFAISGDGK